MKKKVDTAKLRARWANKQGESGPFPVMTIVALLDEIDALRAKLAESEAACEVLGKTLSVRLDRGTACTHRRGIGLACQNCLDALNADVQTILNLPASILSHMKEDAALREVAREGLALRNSGYDGPCIGEPIAPLFRTLANLDAVRAKNGGG